MALPKDFKQESKGGRYTMSALDDQPTKIRILSDFIMGKSVWGPSKVDETKRVPYRFEEGQDIPTSCIGVNKFTGQPETIKQFIAGVVWNYRTEQIEVLETDKSTVIGKIVEIEDNDEYGDSKKYDITLKKTGQKMDTEYSVIASPPKTVEKDIVKRYKDEPVNLKALFESKDPFAQVEATNEDNTTDGEKEDKIPF